MNFQQLRKLSLEFKIESDGDWFIFAGPQRYMVAEGPAFTASFGREIIMTLMDGRPGIMQNKCIYVEAVQERRAM